MSVKKCVNGTSVICKTGAKIEEYTKKASLLFGSGKNYFDFDDYDTPIKQVKLKFFECYRHLMEEIITPLLMDTIRKQFYT